MKCEYCGKERKKRNKHFCSKLCSNRFNAERAYEKGIKGKVCKTCKKRKPKGQFSYNVRGNWFSGLRDTCKRCGANKRERERRARTWKDDAVKVLFDNAKQRAKKANMEFSIEKGDILIPEKCPVLGITLRREKRNGFKFAPSIDRIDNNKGYTKDNVIIVSKRANILKKDATIEELKLLAKFYGGLK